MLNNTGENTGGDFSRIFPVSEWVRVSCLECFGRKCRMAPAAQRRVTDDMLKSTLLAIAGPSRSADEDRKAVRCKA